MKNEKQKEFIVRNNSKSEVRIRSTSSETGLFDISPMPLVLPPSGQAVLTIKPRAGVSQKNYRDLLSLAFEQPVEGMASLIIPIVLNYEKSAETKIMGLTQKDIEELIRKAQQPPIKRGP